MLTALCSYKIENDVQDNRTQLVLCFLRPSIFFSVLVEGSE